MFFFYFNTCTVQVLLFRTLNQQMHTIISQIITLLHVSTLSCHPQYSLQSISCQVTPTFQIQLSVTQFTIKIFLISDFRRVLSIVDFL
jgi:hypothetical protein